MVRSHLEVFFLKNKFINRKLDFALTLMNQYIFNSHRKLIGIGQKKSKIIFDIKAL